MKNTLFFILLFLSVHVSGQELEHLNIGEIQSENYFEEIDFEFINNKVIIPVRIEGKNYKFILDTGAPNLISKELYELLNPKTIGDMLFGDASNKTDSVKVVSIETLQIGSLIFSNTATITYDLNAIQPINCFKVDGLIGSNMLRNSILQIDLDRKKVIITNDLSKLNLNKRSSKKIYLTKVQSNPYLIIYLVGKNKKGKIKKLVSDAVLIDTGMGNLYDLAKIKYNRFESKNKNIFDLTGEDDGASGVGLYGSPDKDKQFQLVIPRLNINSFWVNNATTVTVNDDHSRVGAELLNYGLFTIDYLNRQFYFESDSNKVEVFDRDYGFSTTVKDGCLLVGFVWDKELKETISYGDKIIEIGEKPFSLCDVFMGNLFSNDKNLLTIENSKGEVFKITVEKKKVIDHVY